MPLNVSLTSFILADWSPCTKHRGGQGRRDAKAPLQQHSKRLLQNGLFANCFAEITAKFDPFC